VIENDSYLINIKWHFDLIDSGAMAFGFPWSWTVFYVVTNVNQDA